MNEIRDPYRLSLYLDLLPGDLFRMVLDLANHNKREDLIEHFTTKRDGTIRRREKVNNGIIKIQRAGLISLGMFFVYAWIRPTAKVGPITWLVFGLGMSALIIPPFQPLIDTPFALVETYYTWRLQKVREREDIFN